MDKQTVVTIVVVLAVVGAFLAGPIIINVLRANGATSAKAAAAAQTAEPLQPPLLTEASMIGSVWNVTVQGFTVKVTFGSGGQAVATSDNIMVRQMAKMKFGMDSLPGTWRIEGPKLLLNTNFQGKDLTTELTISGTKLLSKEGVPIVRVQ